MCFVAVFSITSIMKRNLCHILLCKFVRLGVISNFALGLSLKAASNKINAFCLWAGPKPFIVIQNPDDIQVKNELHSIHYYIHVLCLVSYFNLIS